MGSILLFFNSVFMSKNVYYFNPTCELAISNGSFSYMAPRLLRDFEEDCSILLFVFSTEGDYLLTEEKPSSYFIQMLRDAGFNLPVFVNREEISSKNELNKLSPWGWSPATHFLFKTLKDKCSSNFKESPVFNWHENHRLLFERRTSLNFLIKLLNNEPLDFLIPKVRTGTIVDTIEEIELLLNKHTALVLKSPLSSSGRGIQIIRKQSLNASNKQWISGVLQQQLYLIAEPYLDKLIDFSFQFMISDKGEPEYLGYSIFETNSNGQYKSTLINSQIETILPKELYGNVQEMIDLTSELLTLNLRNSMFTTWHRGFLGIDAMIYKEVKEIKLQPCIEINSRMNMGILTMQLEKYVHPEAKGKFELYYGKKGEYEQFANQLTLEKPFILKNGKLFSGFMPLVEPNSSKQFGAYLLLE